jgi:HNH endonuclease
MKRKNITIPRSLVSLILILQHQCCWYCQRVLSMRGGKRTSQTATIDHKTPLWMGGEPYGDNVCVACWECNHLKGPLDEETFRAVRHNARLRKEALIAAQIAAQACAESRKPNTHEEKIERAASIAQSRERLWARVRTRFDELRGDMSLREWFAARALECGEDKAA